MEGKAMKIAQVAPLYESVPPKMYGGTERVVSYLTEELVRQGHDVTLFASGDSVTSARLVAPCRQALRLNDGCLDPLAHHVLMLELLSQVADNFDMIHFHCDYIHFPLSRRRRLPHVSTLHGRLDSPDLVSLYREFVEMPVISISDSQRAPVPWLNWQGTVYHGLPLDLYKFQGQAGTYLAFLGRICADKGIVEAIEIAKKAGIPLRISAKVDRGDREYFKDVVEPLLGHPLIQFVGEISESEKNEFLGSAIALLTPINWPEPFGMVMIEAMACGTPVVAFRRGSVPEVIDEGRSGFIVSSVDEAVAAIKKGRLVSRMSCRESFERRFTACRMARDYLKNYERLLESNNTITAMDPVGTSGPEESAPWTMTSSA
jgi:glycosyltransferase involved in cell wall biosynthesis